MVFGVFDGIHEGHRAMLKEAKSYGTYLIVVVAQDHIVQHLKGHLPQYPLAKRLEHLQMVDGVDEVVIGDSELGSWGVVKKYQPDVIACGYDQNDLKQDLEANFDKLGYKPRLVMLKSFEPEKHHSSLRKN